MRSHKICKAAKKSSHAENRRDAEPEKKAQAFHGRINYRADDQVKHGAKAQINSKQGGGNRLLGYVTEQIEKDVGGDWFV